MKRLNILELNRSITEKKNLSIEVYEKIVSKCHRRIESTTENLKTNCFFQIPEFVIGYPLYDLSKCIEYTVDELKKNGFLVKYYFPKTIYVSWDLKEISNSNKEPKVNQLYQQSIESIEAFMPLPPKHIPAQLVPQNPRAIPLKTVYKPLLSSSIQKNNGKISLNLL